MESEKVEVIKKALDCCANLNGQSSCKDCPIGIGKCYEDENLMPRLALTLINELESENAYKQEHIELWFRKNEEKKNRIAELEKELTNNRVFYKDGICYPMNCQGALKQFAERLKEKAYQVHDGYFEVLTGQPAIAVDIVVLENLLDETLKEFTE